MQKGGVPQMPGASKNDFYQARLTPVYFKDKARQLMSS
jgi:hypothetical protein